MKYAQRLDDARLAEAIIEREMADLDTIREHLQAAQQGGTPFAEAVVDAGLVSDWDLSRIVAEIFQLPFVPVDVCTPNKKVWDELASPTLEENHLVPLGRHGQVLTIAMPGLVPADVLGLLAAETDLVILPVVGTVQTNQRWIADNADGSAGGGAGESWGDLFDQADAAVQADLAEPETAGDSAELELASMELDEALEEASSEIIEPPSLVPESDVEASAGDPDADGPMELPPMPDFNLGA